MLPKTHIILGAIFSILLYYVFNITIFQASLIFFASVFIDVDHYFWYMNKKKEFSLKNAYFHLKNIRPANPMMMLFHTIEFLLIVFLLSFLWKGFLFILIGMLFHSILDIVQMAHDDELHYREFFLISYLLSNKSNYY